MIDSRTSLVTNPPVIDVNYDTDHAYAFYEFSFDKELCNLFFNNNWDIVDAELSFWSVVDASSPIGEVDFIHISLTDDTTSITSASYADLNSAVSAGESIGQFSLSGTTRKLNQKNIVTACDAIVSVIENAKSDSDAHYFIMCVKKSDNSIGFAEVGGQTLIREVSEGWVEAGSEIASPPEIRLTVKFDSSSRASFSMNYTTSDPFTNVSNPSLSIGGYAKNNIYTNSNIVSGVNKSSSSVLVDSLPSSSTGVISVGPEIMLYNAASSGSIAISKRPVGVSGSSISNAEKETKAIYLDVNKLFNTAPTDSLVQYRCVAVKLDSDVFINDIVVDVLQKKTNNILVDCAIEVPEFDSHSGIHSGENGDFIEDSTSFTSEYPASGKYEGGFLIIEDDSSRIGIIESFTFSDGTAVIHLENPIEIETGESYRIIPAKSQRVTNETTSPDVSLFTGKFFSDDGSNEVIFSEHSIMEKHDLFYLWIRLTWSPNKKSSTNSGAIIQIKYKELFNSVSVELVDSTTCDWIFSDDIATYENPTPELEVVATQWESPTATALISSNTLRCTYTGPLNISGPNKWRIREQPEGLSFDNGRTVNYMISGVVE